MPKKDGTVHHPLVRDDARCSGLPIRTASRRMSGPRARRISTTPTSASSTSIRHATTSRTSCARRRCALRDLLNELGLPSWVKTSGSKGFHIVVPLDAQDEHGRRRRLRPRRGSLLVTRYPRHLTQEFIKADRGGRILLDTGRNGYSATFAAAYAVRAKRGAPVSAPCTWEEVESGTVEPQTFTLRNMSDRVAKVGDLWSDMRKRKRSLRTPIERLRKLSKKAR